MEIRQLTLLDESLFPDGLELLNRTQGRDLFAKDYLLKSVQDPESYVLAAFINNELVSIAVAKLLHDFVFYEPFDANISKELSTKKVGSFSTLCTREDLQGKGIGHQLSLKRMEWLKEQKCDVILGISWVSGKTHTSDKGFLRMGFKKVKQLSEFFVESSTKNPFVCPACGEPPCTCPAILFRCDL